ncbi:MAG: alpha/beta hydrolase, partial [Pseudomonas fluorescens]
EETIKVLISRGYRVIAPDQIGFCKSDKPKGYQYSLNQLAVNTNALLRNLGIEQPIVIGHSMGGMLAARYAIMYPQQLEKLVLVNPIGLEDWQAKGVPYATVDTLYANELKTSFESIKNYQLNFYYNDLWKPEYDRWVDMQAGMYAGKGKEVVAMSQAQTSDMIFNQPVVYELGKIKTPTVLIIGGKDRTAPGANRAVKEVADALGDYPVLGREAAKAIKGSKLVELPELGHSPQVENPTLFHEKLLELL